MECCGIDGPQYWRFANGSVPLSCCSSRAESCTPTSQSLHPEGCVDALYSFLEKAAKILGYVVIGIASTEVILTGFQLTIYSLENSKST